MTSLATVLGRGPVLAALVLLASCTHHAGVLRTYEAEQPVVGSELPEPGAEVTVQLAADTWSVSKDGHLRGTAQAHRPGTIEYELTSHSVEAVDHYDVAEAWILRPIALPFYLGFLLPIFGNAADYGGDGHVGFGDHVLDLVHTLNPLMAWPQGGRSPGEDTVTASKRVRRAAQLPVAMELELALQSARGSQVLPVVPDAQGAFEVDLRPCLERVWDDELRVELRERGSGRVQPLPALASSARDYLRSIGQLTALQWTIACEADTREAYARFVAANRDHPRAEELLVRLHEVDWRAARADDDRPAYAAFLRQHPTSPHAAEAQLRIEEVDWRDAAREDTIAGYTRFLAAAPGSDRAPAAERRRAELQLAEQWLRAQRIDTPAAYREFVARHGGTSFGAEARVRLDLLDAHAADWAAACAVGTKQGFLDYQARHRDSPYLAAADKALRDLEGRDIADLIEEGKVEIETTGGGIQSVRVGVRRLTPYPLRVRIPVGSYFVSARATAQNMVVTGEATLHLVDTNWHDAQPPAACASMPKDIPGHDDSFTIERPQHVAALARLMPVLDRHRADYATRQAAVWIVTDDASFGQLGTLVSRPAGMAFGGTSLIGAPEAARAMQMCTEAGLAIEATRIVQDRERILAGLPDGDLKTWLQAQVPAPQKR